MPDSVSPVASFSRYASLIDAASSPSQFVPESESATALQVERGTVFCLMQKDAARLPDERIDRILELSSSDRIGRIAIVDRTGHHRPIYRALLVYAMLQAFRLGYEVLPRSAFGRWEEG